jgi:fructose-1,6-bisphosphatase/inositol monophosphatase family enzyme
VVGCVSVPALGEELYAARGSGAWWTPRGRETRPARVSSVASLEQALVESLPGPTFIRSGLWPVYERLCRGVWLMRGWSDAYAFVLVATGRADGAVDMGLQPWDVAPFQVILEEAGGSLTDWSGQATIYSERVVASNGLLHRPLLALLR